MRKLTFTNVKANCPLFRQKELTIDQKVRNLESLIGKQLVMSVSATMEDLEEAIIECGKEMLKEPSKENEIKEKGTEDRENKATKCRGDRKQTSAVEADWPPIKGAFIMALFTDRAYPGEVMEIEGDYVEADFFVPAKVSQMEDIVSLWKRPSMDKDEQYTVHRNSILPIRPVFELNKFSTHRMVIYELVNADLVAKFV